MPGKTTIRPCWLPGVLLALVLPLAAPAQDSSTGTLYRRIGGYDVIASITDAFLGRMRADPRFARFAGGRSLDSRTRARQLSVDLLCQMAGGPCTYIGRPMKAAHAGLGITEADWQGLIEHVAASLDQLKVPARERQEFLDLFSKMKAEIIEAGAN